MRAPTPPAFGSAIAATARRRAAAKLEQPFPPVTKINFSSRSHLPTARSPAHSSCGWVFFFFSFLNVLRAQATRPLQRPLATLAETPSHRGTHSLVLLRPTEKEKKKCERLNATCMQASPAIHASC